MKREDCGRGASEDKKLSLDSEGHLPNTCLAFFSCLTNDLESAYQSASTLKSLFNEVLSDSHICFVFDFP